MIRRQTKLRFLPCFAAIFAIAIACACNGEVAATSNASSSGSDASAKSDGSECALIDAAVCSCSTQATEIDPTRGCSLGPTTMTGLCIYGPPVQEKSDSPYCVVSPEGEMFLFAVSNNYLIWGAGWSGEYEPEAAGANGGPYVAAPLTSLDSGNRAMCDLLLSKPDELPPVCKKSNDAGP